jgi:lipoyl(octanoyl) transferase
MVRRRYLGLADYQTTFDAMKAYTAARDDHSDDELWILEHPPVFTQGLSGKAEHILVPSDIPIVQIDRGGQVTYHGPGQIVVYLLLDIRRLGLGVRALVTLIEQALIRTLASYGIEACADPEAPGVYVDGRKIASLGLKISRGCSYHGLALNVDMDLTPFQTINPCGYAGLEVTSLARLLDERCPDKEAIGERLLADLEWGIMASSTGNR